MFGIGSRMQCDIDEDTATRFGLGLMRLLFRYALLRSYEFLASSKRVRSLGQFSCRACSSSAGGSKTELFVNEERINAAFSEKYGFEQQPALEAPSGYGSLLVLDDKAGDGRGSIEDKEESILAAIEERYSRKQEVQGSSKFEFLSVLQQHPEDADGADADADADDDAEGGGGGEGIKERARDASDSELSDDPPLVEYVRREKQDTPTPTRCFFNWAKLRKTIVDECVEALEKRTASTDLKVVLERWDGMVGNALVSDVLSRIKDPDAAFAFFKFAGQQYNFTHDAISYEGLIRFLVRVARDYRRGALIYKYVERARVQPNTGMMELLVEAAVEGGEIDQGLEFMEMAWKLTGKLTPEMCRRVTVGLFKAGRIDDAMELFETKMDLYGCEKHVTNYNAVLAGLSKAGKMEEMVEVFESMEARNVTSFVIMVDGFAHRDDLPECLKFARRMALEGVRSTASMYAAVIGLFGKIGQVDEALEWYEKMMEQQQFARSRIFRPDPRAFNATLAALSPSLDDPERLQQCRDVAWRMIRDGYVPDALEFFRLVTKLCDAGKDQLVKDMFGQIEKRSRRLEAEQCFQFVERLCQDHRVDIAMKFYRVMIRKKVMLDGKTFGILFSELCRTGAADDAYLLFAKLDEMDAVHYDGETHRLVFDELCRAKRASRAFKVYASMVKQGLPTDEVMLASLLSGLLQEEEGSSHHKVALAVYNAMLRRGCPPAEESCRMLVEALSRAGDLENAEKVAADTIEKSFFVQALI